MINTKFLKLTLESNGETLELGNDEYKLLEVYELTQGQGGLQVRQEEEYQDYQKEPGQEEL